MSEASVLVLPPQAASPSFAYADLFRATPLSRIKLVKGGVPARSVKALIGELRFEQKTMLDALNLKTATLNKKAARGESLSTEESERVVGLARLIGQVEAMVQDSGGSEGFEAAEWLARWLREPLPALGGTRPIELLDTMEGQALVSGALAAIEGGAYA